jgi:hypothetical protein
MYDQQEKTSNYRHLCGKFAAGADVDCYIIQIAPESLQPLGKY